MIQTLGFSAVAAVTVASALAVVRSKNLIRAVLWLALSLLGTAVLYAMLGAPFLAGVQVLTYIGGVVTLIIFGVMVTRRHEGATITADHADGDRGLLVAGALFVLFALATFNTELGTGEAPPPPATAELASALLGAHLLAFEAASLLLLAAIIGAVVLARRRDPDPVTGREPGALPPLTQRAGGPT